MQAVASVLSRAWRRTRTCRTATVAVAVDATMASGARRREHRRLRLRRLLRAVLLTTSLAGHTGRHASPGGTFDAEASDIYLSGCLRLHRPRVDTEPRRSESHERAAPGVSRPGSSLALAHVARVALAAGHGHRANALGRTWNWTTSGLLPLPPSLSHGVRSPLVTQIPRPFQPPRGSSMRPSRPLA
jgi:hypothetical protein